MSTRSRVTAVLTSALAAGALGVAGAPSASAEPNVCGQAYMEKAYPWDSTGRIVHSCSAGTQVVYRLDCLVTDVSYAVYFTSALSMSKPVSCGVEGNTWLGLSYEFA